MVDRTFSQKTWTAFHRLADDAGERSGGTGSAVVSSAEDRDCGDAQGGGDVHRSGVVGEEDLATGGQIDELGESGAAGVVGDVISAQQGCDFDLTADFPLGLRSKEGDGGATRAGNSRRR